jgi:hypothetical protein
MIAQLIEMVESFADCVGVLRAGQLQTFASVQAIRDAGSWKSDLRDELSDPLGDA